jgi:hypothetical protein
MKHVWNWRIQISLNLHNLASLYLYLCSSIRSNHFTPQSVRNTGHISTNLLADVAFFFTNYWVIRILLSRRHVRMRRMLLMPYIYWLIPREALVFLTWTSVPTQKEICYLIALFYFDINLCCVINPGITSLCFVTSPCNCLLRECEKDLRNMELEMFLNQQS